MATIFTDVLDVSEEKLQTVSQKGLLLILLLLLKQDEKEAELVNEEKLNMKLKNKKTGEIATLTLSTNGEDLIIMGNDMYAHITKLSELKDYEDYEEPKKYCVINPVDWKEVIGEIEYRNDNTDKINREIGNYFETKEEAEKAVEKLKAMARLNKFGFRFIDWELDMKTVADGKIWFDIGVNTQWDADHLLKCEPEVKKSLDLLFGGEE